MVAFLPWPKQQPFIFFINWTSVTEEASVPLFYIQVLPSTASKTVLQRSLSLPSIFFTLWLLLCLSCALLSILCMLSILYLVLLSILCLVLVLVCS
jgi:hypothetical protein